MKNAGHPGEVPCTELPLQLTGRRLNDLRLIFIGRYYRERSVSELAAELGIAEGTVLSSIHRTKKGLADFLKKRGVSI